MISPVPDLSLGMCGVCDDLPSRCVDAGERCPRPEAQEMRKHDPQRPFGSCASIGPRHDRTGTTSAAAHLGGHGYRAKVEVLAWTGCNGQRCGRDCGPGHHVVLWVPCRFAVGNGHHYTLSDEEIARLRDALGIVP